MIKYLDYNLFLKGVRPLKSTTKLKDYSTYKLALQVQAPIPLMI